MVHATPSTGTALRAPRYRWALPTESFLREASPRISKLMMLQVAAIAGVMSLPPVVRATGISPFEAVPLLSSYVARDVFSNLVLVPRVDRSRVSRGLYVGLDLFFGLGICLALPALTRDPESPLWMVPVMYSAMNGALYDAEPSLTLLLLHGATPLLTMPWFLLVAPHSSWSIAGPVLAALFCTIAYHLIGERNLTMQVRLHEQEQLVARLHARETELERRHLAQDLHDQIASPLATAAVYGSVIREHLHDPEELRRVARAIEESAQAGLADLRGVVEGLDPSGNDLTSFARMLELHARRRARPHAADFELEVHGDALAPLPARTRIAAARFVSEAVHNALHHGCARHIHARVELVGGELHVHVEDDGAGFNPARAAPGRGLGGMRRRAEELGGRFEVHAAPGHPTRLVLHLPLPSGDQVAS